MESLGFGAALEITFRLADVFAAGIKLLVLGTLEEVRGQRRVAEGVKVRIDLVHDESVCGGALDGYTVGSVDLPLAEAFQRVVDIFGWTFPQLSGLGLVTEIVQLAVLGVGEETLVGTLKVSAGSIAGGWFVFDTGVGYRVTESVVPRTGGIAQFSGTVADQGSGASVTLHANITFRTCHRCCRGSSRGIFIDTC